MFDEYYKGVLIDTNKMYYSYVGITKKDYPKWDGWKIINKYKECGISIEDIKDKRLDLLVENFYRLKYLEEMFSN